MTVVSLARAPDLTTSTVARRRSVANAAATAAMCVAFLVAMVPLVLIIGYLLARGGRVISWDFLSGNIPLPTAKGPGMGPAVVGTLVITGAAAVMAIPLGVFGAIYLNEFGRRSRLASVIRFMADVMTGVPSIVMGLFIYTIWVLRYGQSGLAGALALACLMLPVVIRTTEEMLRLVPTELRHGSVALGARTWRTVLTVVLPAALPGIVSGAMLAVARAAGETAPLLFTIGIVRERNASLSGPNTALSAQIFSNASQPFAGAIDRAWGAAFTLVLLVFLLTVVARMVAARFASESN
ncbi:MAG: phosphate ABC transporter permease PstA [Acidobacteria bacterium]|nr:phosphate ABC transporter permease PstA [Acidobacteriota bacterium]